MGREIFGFKVKTFTVCLFLEIIGPCLVPNQNLLFSTLGNFCLVLSCPMELLSRPIPKLRSLSRPDQAQSTILFVR